MPMLIELREGLIIRDSEILLAMQINQTVFVYYANPLSDRPVESATIHDEFGRVWKFISALAINPQDT